MADGIVESVDIVKGSYANETQTLMTIINADKIGVEFAISKDDLTAITEGQKARVVIADKEYTGEVEFVSIDTFGDDDVLPPRWEPHLQAEVSKEESCLIIRMSPFLWVLQRKHTFSSVNLWGHWRFLIRHFVPMWKVITY